MKTKGRARHLASLLVFSLARSLVPLPTVSLVIGGQCRRLVLGMVLPLGRGREPPRPEGGSPKTPGRVQPHSLLRESVTGGDL